MVDRSMKELHRDSGTSLNKMIHANATTPAYGSQKVETFNLRRIDGLRESSIEDSRLRVNMVCQRSGILPITTSPPCGRNYR